MFLSQLRFYLSNQESITGNSGVRRPALIKAALFEKGTGTWGRVYGVKDYNFGSNNGYIKYTNGFNMEWSY